MAFDYLHHAFMAVGLGAVCLSSPQSVNRWLGDTQYSRDVTLSVDERRTSGQQLILLVAITALVWCDVRGRVRDRRDKTAVSLETFPSEVQSRAH